MQDDGFEESSGRCFCKQQRSPSPYPPPPVYGKVVLFSPIPQLSDKYFYWIDFSRMIAALSVVIWHYQHLFYFTGSEGVKYIGNLNRDIQPFYNFLEFFYHYGGAGVSFFWVISGFVFSSVYYQKQVTGRRFFQSRFARLYPLHFLTLIIILLLQTLSTFLHSENQVYSLNDAYHFLLNIFHYYLLVHLLQHLNKLKYLFQVLI